MHDGRMLVYKSRDPECDAARALTAMNRRGVLHLYDGLPGGRAGKLRTIVSIAKAARLTTREGRGAPYFTKYRETAPSASPSPEDTPADYGKPRSPQGAVAPDRSEETPA
jgi:hypothetical protein